MSSYEPPCPRVQFLQFERFVKNPITISERNGGFIIRSLFIALIVGNQYNDRKISPSPPPKKKKESVQVTLL